MKNKTILTAVVLVLFLANNAFAQEKTDAQQSPKKELTSEEKQVKSDQEIEKKAVEWVGSLNLNETPKEQRLQSIITTHLKAVRDWNNEHSGTTVPAGINPATGQKLSDLERQIIVMSSMPLTIHDNLMTGLRKDLTEEKVALILDKYTIGKVQFTMAGYKSIIPDLTAQEEEAISTYLKQAREQAVDYKSMKQISAIFEIYKTKSEQYLNNNGRNWKQSYKAFTDAIKAKKAAEKQSK
jgi:MinD superfamily P-loop ATPase